MHPFEYFILADENIHQEVVYHLRNRGKRIESIKERNLLGSSDEQIITLAQEEGTVILTHDSDFGRIIYTNAA